MGQLLLYDVGLFGLNGIGPEVSKQIWDICVMPRYGRTGAVTGGGENPAGFPLKQLLHDSAPAKVYWKTDHLLVARLSTTGSTT